MLKLFLHIILIIITIPSYSQVWEWIGPYPDDKVYALKEYKGLLYVGGFYPIGLGTWDGNGWTSSLLTNTAVYTLELFDDTLFVGGAFTSVTGVPCNYLAKFYGQTWTAIGTGLTGSIRCIEKFNNELYIGGNFYDSIAGIYNIAKWNGNNWVSIGNIDSIVHTMEVYNNKLFIGGNFTNAGGMNANNFAAWNGNSWSTIGAGTDQGIYSLKAVDTSLFIAGNMFVLNGDSVFKFACLTDSNIYKLGNDTIGGGFACIYPHNNNIFLGGFFIWIGQSTTYSSVIQFNQSGWNNLNCPLYLNGILAIEYYDGWYYAGGHFQPYNWIRFSLSTDVTEIIEFPNLIIHPNPSSDLLTISTPYFYDEIIITDIAGKTVYVKKEKISNGSKIEISSLTSGMYLLTLKDSKQHNKVAGKFIKK